jgi:LysR family hydrogen peroxide-inducible transcriptional activator
MALKTQFSLTQLEYVLAVYKYGHFAQAAEACHVTQPTLSMQIQKLESDLGVILFDRSKKPILLTDVGKKIIDQMQEVLSEANKISEIIDQSQSEKLHGKLVLGVIPTVAPYVLPLLLPVLRDDYPEIELKILEMETHRIVDALGTDEIDVGLLATPLKIPRIFEFALFYEPFSVLCRKDHEIAKLKKVKYSSLNSDDIWLLAEGHCLRNQVLDICSSKKNNQVSRKYQFESGSLETLKNLINSYGGYTLLPALAGETIGSNTELIPFDRPIPAREIGLVHRREHFKSHLIEALGQTIIKCIPEQIRKIRKRDLDVLPVE